MTTHHKLFQIFKAGTHTAMNGMTLSFTEQDLEYIAAGYSKARLSAPLVLGHPVDSKPEYGEADALFVQGDALYAQATVKDELVAMVRARNYTKVSAFFILPDASDNPTPGVYYLRHVGFLGAMPPAVKGLAALSFTEHSRHTVSFSECHSVKSAGMDTRPFWGSLPVDPARQEIFNLAKDYQRVCPGLSFAEASQRAESIITTQEKEPT